MPRSEERGGMAARSVAEEQESSWFKKPRPEGRGSLLTVGFSMVYAKRFSQSQVLELSTDRPVIYINDRHLTL